MPLLLLSPLTRSRKGSRKHGSAGQESWRPSDDRRSLHQFGAGNSYTWSVISKEIPANWGWKEAEKSWPYAIACLVFAIMMVPAGRLQDKIGPRLVATFGGLLVGAGMILASMTTSYWGYVIGFGILAGTGIGFGYASATPPAVKWFRAARTGMIAGIVVSGFGLASVYAAPLSKWLIAGAARRNRCPRGCRDGSRLGCSRWQPACSDCSTASRGSASAAACLRRC